MNNMARTRGLVINQENTKQMRISKKTHNQCNHIAVGGYRCEGVCVVFLI